MGIIELFFSGFLPNFFSIDLFSFHHASHLSQTFEASTSLLRLEVFLGAFAIIWPERFPLFTGQDRAAGLEEECYFSTP